MSANTTPGQSATRRLLAYAAIACVSFVAYILARLLDGPAAGALFALGVSACGWSWLLTRALFDPAPHDAAWPRLVVAVLVVTGAIGVAAPPSALTSVAQNTYSLVGSAALLLTVIEPFQRHGCALDRTEVRFRIAFLGVFALLAGVAVLGAWGSPEPVQIACAITGLVWAIVATAWRLGHPLRPVEKARRPATEEEVQLSERLRRLIEKEAIYSQPDLRIGHVAARLGEAEHKISRCISTVLGFANFNRLINHHRIALAKHLLAAPAEQRSVLEIALDCGFASLGPFNRAFKEETGVTPRAWRAAAAGAAAP